MLDATLIATAPGKLILTGEYAVLDGAPALVVAIDRRVVARIRTGAPRGSSPFLIAIADELAKRRGAEDPSVRAAMEIAVESSTFYDGVTKLGLGSSAAVTVAATALALGASRGTSHRTDDLDRDEVLAIARAAHATAQGSRASARSRSGRESGTHMVIRESSHARGSDSSMAGRSSSVDIIAQPLSSAEALRGPVRGWSDPSRGAGDPTRGSGADIAAAVYGGVIVFQTGAIERRTWPSSVRMIPFFTGASADTASLVARVFEARTTRAAEVDAALSAITDASRAAVLALSTHGAHGSHGDLAATGLIGAFALGAMAIDRLAIATGVALVPDSVRRVRGALARIGGTAKTTGAGGGDVAVAVIPATADADLATRMIIEAGGQPLRLLIDDTGVDLRADAS